MPSTEVSVRTAWGSLIVTAVGGEEAAGLLVSAAFVAVTVQVPAVVALSLPALTTQPVAVPLIAVKVTVPLPSPPDAVSVSGVPRTPVSEVTVTGGAFRVTAVPAEETGR